MHVRVCVCVWVYSEQIKSTYRREIHPPLPHLITLKFLDMIISSYWSCYRSADAQWNIIIILYVILYVLYCVLALSSAVDNRSGTKVAIKKLYRPFQSELFAKRAYRELRLLKHMKHENVRHSTIRAWSRGSGVKSHSADFFNFHTEKLN